MDKAESHRASGDKTGTAGTRQGQQGQVGDRRTLRDESLFGEGGEEAASSCPDAAAWSPLRRPVPLQAGDRDVPPRMTRCPAGATSCSGREGRMPGLETGCHRKNIKHLLVQMERPHLNAADPGAAAGLSPVQRSKRLWEEFPASSSKTSLSALNRPSAKMPTKDRQGLRGRPGGPCVVGGRCIREGHSHPGGAGPERFPAGWSLLPPSRASFGPFA